MATIVLTGGGTAGHIMPNLALVPELSKYFDKIAYIGGDGMEKELVKKHELPFYEVKTIKFDREKMLSNLRIPFLLMKGIKEAKEILRSLGADVVFSKGGYAALPACFAAKSLKIPVITHESDFTLGLANKLISPFAKKLLISFPETECGGEYSGNPIRPEILKGDKERAKQKYKIGARPMILIFGGSLGSESINKAVYAALPELTKRYNIVHITGKTGKEIKTAGYRKIEFASDIEDLYAAAEAVVLRGGANSLSEVAALGKRAICIPLPKGKSRGDQEDNAKSYKNRKLIEVIYQQDLSADTLIKSIDTIMLKSPPEPQKNIAVDKIVKEILSVIKKD